MNPFAIVCLFVCLPIFSKFLTRGLGDFCKKEMIKSKTKITVLLLWWVFVAWLGRADR